MIPPSALDMATSRMWDDFEVLPTDFSKIETPALMSSLDYWKKRASDPVPCKYKTEEQILNMEKALKGRKFKVLIILISDIRRFIYTH